MYNSWCPNTKRFSCFLLSEAGWQGFACSAGSCSKVTRTTPLSCKLSQIAGPRRQGRKFKLRFAKPGRTLTHRPRPNTTINCRVCLSEQGIVDLIEELEKRWLALETLGQKKEKLKADKAKQAARKKKAKQKKNQSTQMNFLAMSLGKREKAMVKGTVQQKETGSKTKPLPGKHIERLFAKTNPEVVKQVLRMAINKEVEVKDMPKEAQKLMSILRGRIAFCLVAEVESLEAAVDCLPAHYQARNGQGRNEQSGQHAEKVQVAFRRENERLVRG